YVIVAGQSDCEGIGGQCLNWQNYLCTAGYETGLCPGDSNVRCCLPCNQACMDQEADWSSGDGECVAEGGRCMMDSNYCAYTWQSGKCGGPADRKCCVQGDCPRIVSREEWGARPPNGETFMETPVSFVIIHHTEGPHCYSQADCIPIVRSIQNYHMDSNGWNDIGFFYASFLVGEDGNGYEGRGWDKVGAHTPGFNDRGIAISVIGSFMSSLPNNAALNTVQGIIDCGISLGYIRSNYELLGHRQASSTDCPGDALYEEITTWDHWTSNP
ncbi:unnamed protein product, partial [Darwinula stevensoni]